RTFFWKYLRGQPRTDGHPSLADVASMALLRLGQQTAASGIRRCPTGHHEADPWPIAATRHARACTDLVRGLPRDGYPGPDGCLLVFFELRTTSRPVRDPLPYDPSMYVLTARAC